MKAIATALLLMAVAAPASAQPERFDGSCEFAGTVSFSPPMTSTPQPIAQSADAPGTCSGTFTDRRGRAYSLTDAPTTYRAQSAGDAVSCAFGVASGEGVLAFRRGSIGFAMTEYRGGATPLIRLTGNAGGEAWMPVTPSQDGDPVAAVQACNGAGLESFALDAHMRTIGAISG
ncbi:MAG TPA: hypothetical protein VF066_03470 [Thermoleophilaceae bacterium]